MNKAVVVLGTFDTKGVEFKFIKDIIESQGVPTISVNAGVKGPPHFTPDISNEEVAKAGGLSLRELIEKNDRGAAIDVMMKGAAQIVTGLYQEGKVAGIISLGGSAGTTIGSYVMQALPVGVPKIMVSTVASGDTRPYVGVKDVTMMYSVIDISGINVLSSQILANAANAIAGMAKGKVPEIEGGKVLLGATMFGVTTPCVTRAREYLEEHGYEVLVFHATGTGGRAMESLIEVHARSAVVQHIAYAGLKAVRMVRRRVVQAEAVPYPLHDRVQRLYGGYLQDNDEFVAPEPENAVPGTQALAENADGFDQRLISCGVPKSIVDVFESVQVQHQTGEKVVSAALPYPALDVCAQLPPVVGAGQRIRIQALILYEYEHKQDGKSRAAPKDVDAIYKDLGNAAKKRRDRKQKHGGIMVLFDLFPEQGYFGGGYNKEAQRSQQKQTVKYGIRPYEEIVTVYGKIQPKKKTGHGQACVGGQYKPQPRQHFPQTPFAPEYLIIGIQIPKRDGHGGQREKKAVAQIVGCHRGFSGLPVHRPGPRVEQGNDHGGQDKPSVNAVLDKAEAVPPEYVGQYKSENNDGKQIYIHKIEYFHANPFHQHGCRHYIDNKRQTAEINRLLGE
jgi:hypothetical protein